MKTVNKKTLCISYITPVITEMVYFQFYLTEMVDEAVRWVQRGPKLGRVHPGQAIEQNHIKVFERAL